jgi:nucleotide-binding universal stress UspA family protein
VSAETRILEASVSGAASLFGAMARRFDLAVVGQAQRERGPSEELVVEAALFESGRPVVFVPYIQRQGLKLDRVLVCWDGSRTAARAIGDAMPFLERAKAVEVLTIAEENKQEEIAGGDMVAHLGRHGIPTSPKRTSMGEISIENVILSYAADSGADFLVMGGYGHSRWREFILGGATRGILASMTLPVLMSH